MKIEQTFSVNNSIVLEESVSKCMSCRTSDEKTVTEKKVLGDILSDIRFTWLAKGSKLEVFHSKSGTKVASWSFRSLHDFEACVSCVVDFPSAQSKIPLLVVGLECEFTGDGMICVFDVTSSSVIRSIQIEDKVTSVHVVSTGSETSLPGVLRDLDGIVAVGTSKGKVFLIDLCRQICEEAISNYENELIRDELNPCHLTSLSYQDLKNLESHKEKSLNKGDHLRFQLNEPSTSDVHFTLWGPSGDIRLRANKDEVIVSSLHWCSALGSLLVGYNFGCFQLYNLLTPNLALEYTSPMYEDCIPVAHFAFQEPCDDPRSFCYIWVTYSVTDNGDNGESMAVMYSLNYKEKDWLEGYGVLYQELVSCSVRFQIELAKIIDGKKYLGARCISLRSYTQPLSLESPEERLSLCTLIWTCWRNNKINTDTYLALFDLNQWYKEQMPAHPKPRPTDNEKYMSIVSLTDILDNRDKNEDVLDLRVDPQSLNPFICAQRLEEHYYPSALSFGAVCFSTTRITNIFTTGAQRHLLAQLKTSGSLCLLQPSELYYRCIALGLAVGDTSLSTTTQQQRTVILTVALEHELVQWLCCCVKDWANGAQAAAGCTLDWMLDWAWQKANSLKFQANELCVPLFDYTGDRLDGNALTLFNHSACQLKCLTTVFETVVNNFTLYFSDQDIEDICYQYRSLQMISTYLEVLQWLLNVGLLPECPLSMYPRPNEVDRISAPYPAESLSRFYSDRRKELRALQYESEDSTDSLLFIDNLLEMECGGSMLRKQWECDGGSGLYPPPSLQALLRTYFIDNIDLVYKHCLFIYVFLDLAMTLDQSRYKSIITHLIKFPAVFKLSPSIIKITQAFWQLDHGDFSTAMVQFLDPAVAAEDIKPWHHRTVLRALLLQGQREHALLYLQVRKPLLSNVQDICIVITLLVINDLLPEALNFQQQNRSIYNEKEILNHFFSVSEKAYQLQEVLFLPLRPTEEQAFTTYLKNHPSEENNIFLIIYYLQRERYAEAFEVNDKFNSCFNTTAQQGLLGQQDKNFRNVIVTGFKKTLPDVSQELYSLLQKMQKEKGNIWQSLDRPVPMSVFIHDPVEKPKYRSTLIQASLQKAKETWTQLTPNNKINLDETPFVSTLNIAQTDNTSKETKLIYATTVMQPDVHTDLDPEMEATPAKRMRLSPRQSINSSENNMRRSQRLSFSNDVSSFSLLDTPIVKRRSYRADSVTRENIYRPIIGSPASILKVRSFIRQSVSPDIPIAIDAKDNRGTSTTPENLDEMEQDSESGIIPLNWSSNSINSSRISTFSEQPRRRSPLGISPRRSIQRTPRLAVHFEEVSRPGSRSSEGSTCVNIDHQLEVPIEVHREQTPDPLLESENNSHSTEDVFYSPNASLSNSNNTTNVTEVMEVEMDDSTETRRASLKRKASDRTVKSRRSYKSTPNKTEEINLPKTRSFLKSRESMSKSSDDVPKAVVIPVKKSPVPTTSKILITSSEENSPSSPKKSDLFPKIGGRRSLSRQVLEQNTLARAMQNPRMQTRLSWAKMPVLEKIDQNTVGVEMSYSKTVTSITKKSSDSVTEESCDKNTIETKNVFTTEKDPESSAQIIKHVHNESSSKSSVKKITEVLENDVGDQITSDDKNQTINDTDYHVLSFNSDIVDSRTPNSLEKSYASETDEESVEINTPAKFTDISVQIADESLSMNKNNRTNLSTTVFEDISTVVLDESVWTVNSKSDNEESMEISETNIETDDKEMEEKPEEIQEVIEIEEHSFDSSEVEKDSNQSEIYEENNYIQNEEIEENSAEKVERSEEEEEDSEEDEQHILRPSSDEDSDDMEEKLSNQEEEQEQEEEEQSETESSEEDISEESNQDTNSSNSPKIIEIKSSSEESLDKLQMSGETEASGIVLEQNICEDDYEREIEEEVEDINAMEVELAEDEEIQQEIEINTVETEEICQEIETEIEINAEEQERVKAEGISQEIKDDIEINIVEEDLTEAEEIHSEIKADIEIHAADQEIVKDVTETEIVQQKSEEHSETPVEIQMDVEEAMETEKQIVVEGFKEENNLQNNVKIVEQTANVIEPQLVLQQLPKDQTENIKETLKKTSKTTIPQETINISQPVQELIQTKTTFDENVAKQTVPESDISYTPSRKSNRISSKQEKQPIIDETPTPLRTRKRSTSIDVETRSKKELSKPEPGRKTNIESKSSVTAEECSSVEKEIPKSTLRFTRKRSTSIDVDAKPVATEEDLKSVSKSTRKRSASIDIELKSANVEEIPKPRSIRTRSTSVDIETKSLTAETELKSTPKLTRKRSKSIDIEAVSSLAEEESKPTSRSTRKRSTSVDTELKSAEESSTPKSRILRKKMTTEEDIPRRSTRSRSSSIEAEGSLHPKEENRKRSTRASSVVSLPVIEEETQGKVRTRRASSVETESKSVSSPSRRGRKQSSHSDVIDEEIESDEVKKTALEIIPEKMEEYAATHRLTRRQKMIMEKSLELQELKKLELPYSKSQSEDVGDNQRVSLEEDHHNRSTSPASSVSTTKSNATRSGDTPGTPKRKRGRPSNSKTSSPDTPIQRTPVTPTRRSTRTMSRDTISDDVASVKSVSSVPIELEEEKTERARYRSLSPKALQEPVASLIRTRRYSRNSTLSKISEENSSEHSAQSEDPLTGRKQSQTKRTRLEKSEKRDSQPSQSSRGSQHHHRRATKYRPASDYAPRLSMFKTRKVLKIKKSRSTNS